MSRFLLLVCLLGGIAACQPGLPFADEDGAAEPAPAAAQPEGAPAGELGEAPEQAGARNAPEVDLVALARRPRGEETICRAFARHIAEAALRHGDDVPAFLANLQDEFVAGTDDPFELKEGLRERLWNPRYFYAGHGGFRPEYDDAQRYARGGNHQPGHFVSVLSVAARFGEEQARVAIAYARDYDPGEEDDLRLSMVAIPLGAGLRDGTVSPARVAQRARELCL